MTERISIGLPISKLTPISSLSKEDLLIVSEYGSEDIYSTKRTSVEQIRDAISGDIYDYTIHNMPQVSSDIAVISNSLCVVLDRIPLQTYNEGNELADKDFVNSSIQTNTATFRGTFDLSTELPTTSVENNDYAFVTEKDEEGNISAYNRYKYTIKETKWLWEYKINSSGFTSIQWKAINSGITDELVAQIPLTGTYITNDQIDGTTLKLQNKKLSVGTITKNMISDLPQIPSVESVNNKVEKTDLSYQKWTFHMIDGTEVSYNVALSVI